MYAKYFMMRAYQTAERWGAFTWRVVQIMTIAYVLYMALSLIYVGIVRDAEQRGADRKRIENYETFRKMNAAAPKRPVR